MNTETDPDWKTAADAEFARVVALRRAIHADPELGLDCARTLARVRAALADLPLEWRSGSSTGGAIAILRGARADNGQSADRTVLLRGDMDALPVQEESGLPFASCNAGAMHACGHDAHTAMLVGAARALCAHRDAFSGTILFMFQPGEEGYHGAREMIRDGLLDDPRPQAAFALHVSPNMAAGVVFARSGPLMASIDTLRATIKGQGGHAAMPHQSVDPIAIACEIVTALQTMITRRVDVGNPAVLSITKITAGSSHNVIPAEVELLGTLRALSPETRRSVRAAFGRIVEHIAAAHGAIGEWSIEDGYPVTRCDPQAVEVIRACATALGGDDGYSTMAAPMMGGEDFAYVLDHIGGAMAFLGAAPTAGDPVGSPALHNAHMTIDESVMARGIALHCAIAVRFLSQGFGRSS